MKIRSVIMGLALAMGLANLARAEMFNFDLGNGDCDPGAANPYREFEIAAPASGHSSMRVISKIQSKLVLAATNESSARSGLGSFAGQLAARLIIQVRPTEEAPGTQTAYTLVRNAEAVLAQGVVPSSSTALVTSFRRKQDNGISLPLTEAFHNQPSLTVRVECQRIGVDTQTSSDAVSVEAMEAGVSRASVEVSFQ